MANIVAIVAHCVEAKLRDKGDVEGLRKLKEAREEKDATDQFMKKGYYFT